MFLIDGNLRWSASDLTAAAECEYSLLRTLDYTLGWADRIESVSDPLMDYMSALGDRHEARILEEFEADRSVESLPHVERPYFLANLESAARATWAAFAMEPDVVYQACFLDEEFFGYADFVEWAGHGWLVCDAKLARSAKPKALLQLGAYAEQIRKQGLPLSATVSLLLGNGERADFQVADVLPVFGERRERLRALISSHVDTGQAVMWGDETIVACGSCAECKHAADLYDDLTLVAGLRMDQRRKLRAAGILTVTDLAKAALKPDDMSLPTFEKLRAQAALQWKQMSAGQGSEVQFELVPSAAKTLGLLPGPSEGDLFFDFEGDPLYDEGDPTRVGLEYLWGVLTTDEAYLPMWAHDSAQERETFLAFMDLVAERRAKYPEMHIYHYAAYETTALKRLAARYQTREADLADLLRAEVFVDLYATVRGSIRVSAPSYSIKKLEPLYMGDQLRSDGDNAVADGGASVVAYNEFREMHVADPDAAESRLAALADYNLYDCLSTLRLRDWLLERAEDAGVRELIQPRVEVVESEDQAEDGSLFATLMAKAGPDARTDRTPEEQAYAMLATSLDYIERERRTFWWEHFARLSHPVEEWADVRDVFVVESVEVLQDWTPPTGRGSNMRRQLRLVGDWSPGSKRDIKSLVAYPHPGPPGAFVVEGSPNCATFNAGIEFNEYDARVVLLTQSCGPGSEFSDLPIALLPPEPPRADLVVAAIGEVAAGAASSASLPYTPVLDILARRLPRLDEGRSLPTGGTNVDNVVAALTGMTDSYVAIQGPPGTGKTFTGSHVIKELVENHGWRVGVVAQSHAVVENMLASIVKHGLDPSLVGKHDTKSKTPTWTKVSNEPKFLDERRDSGCVIGGTVWAFANQKRIPRGSLDLLVIDEAGQFALAPTLAASVAASRLLLLGDPQQLPQVSQGTHAEPVDESALGWIMDGRDTIPVQRGYFLADSYRMHPDLCDRVSVLSYEGRLSAAPEASRRHMDGVDPGLHAVTISHSGNRTESPEEAAEVVDQVRAAIGATWTDPDDATTPRPLVGSDFLVVAPFNAQVSLIRRALNDAGFDAVKVGTVDKFQGQEAPIAIVSMTASSHGDVPRGMSFLLNRNRVNVAVSRAQWRAILIRSEELTAFMPSSTRGVLELGAFIGLCGEK